MSPTALSSLPEPSVVGDHETEVVVTDIELGADGVRLITLAAPDCRPLTHWSPGAHIDVLMPGGLSRQYSLCSDPADLTSYRIGVLHEPEGRGGSRWLHEELAVGDSLRICGPRNHFELADARSYVFIAGGIGITPMLPMIAAAQAKGVDWHLYYTGRAEASMAFLGELTAYGDRVSLIPRDRQDRIDLAALLATPVPGTLVYTCGPESLLAGIESAMSAAGWAPGALHTEHFTPIEVDKSSDVPFAIELARSGKSLMVGADESILQVVRDAGVFVLASCQEGTCGTCETEVLESDGDLIHRDVVLTEDDKDSGEVIMVCVSRCTGKLTLDL